MSRTPLLPLLAALAVLSAACGREEAPRAARASAPPAAPARPAERPPAGGPPDAGGFRVAYGATADSVFAGWREALRHDGVLEGLAEGLNDWVALPGDVALRLEECAGEENAFYDPERRAISFCYEMVEHLAETFADGERSGEEHYAAVVDAMTFILYHEVGHALVDLLEIPITGREEDAADGLATFMLSDGTAEGARAALSGVVGLQSDQAAFDETDFADVHSLGPVRLANVLCWLYGQDPNEWRHFVDDGHLPPERAEGCAEEYAQLDRSWSRLLEPHLKP